MKILVAEDNAATLKLLSRVIEKLGHEPIPVANGNDALEILRNFDGPSIALIDWMLPGVSGVDICKFVRAGSNMISKYLILVTAKSDIEDIVEGFEAGANDYVTKPFKMPELIARIKTGIKVIELQKFAQELNTKMTHQAKLALVGELSASIIHDIRNPLTIIEGNANKISNACQSAHPDYSTMVRKAEKISTQCKRMNRIITNLLNFSRRDAKHLGKDDWTALSITVENAIELVAHKSEQASIPVTYQSHDDTGSICLAFPGLEQVLVNLLSNACDAVAPLAEKWIRIESKTKEKELQISITDSGTALPQEILTHMMDSFVTTKKKGHGTGLGLSISRRMVEEFGGNLELNTNVEHTQFEITLPLPDQIQSGEAVPFTVLVVDDDPDVLEILAEELEDLKIRVLRATSARDAIDLLQASEVDLVCTDLHMPEMNGEELIAEIRANCAQAPQLVLITAESQIDVGNATEKGVSRILFKPQGLFEIRKLVRDAISDKKKRDTKS